MGAWPLKAKLNLALKNQEQFHLATTLDEDDLDVCWFVGVDAASHKTVIVNSHETGLQYRSMAVLWLIATVPLVFNASICDNVTTL